MKSNQLTEMSEEESLLQENLSLVSHGLFSCLTEEQVDLAVSFSHYLSSMGLTRTNYPLFLRLIATNNHWVVDALVGEREAKLLFSSIPPSVGIVRKALGILSFFHPDVIYTRTLEAALGIIQMAYFDPDDGYGIFKLKIADINTLGKFLDKENDQSHPVNSLLLDILDHLSAMNNYNKEPAKSVLARHAFNIRFAYFDHRKKLEDIIPQVLLYNASRRRVDISPTKEFKEVLNEKKRKLKEEKSAHKEGKAKK